MGKVINVTYKAVNYPPKAVYPGVTIGIQSETITGCVPYTSEADASVKSQLRTNRNGTVQSFFITETRAEVDVLTDDIIPLTVISVGRPPAIVQTGRVETFTSSSIMQTYGYTSAIDAAVKTLIVYDNGNGDTTQYFVGETQAEISTLTTVTGGGGGGSTNASDLTSGTLNNSRLSPDVTLQTNLFNGSSQLIKTTADGKYPALDGSLITGIAGGDLSTVLVKANNLSDLTDSGSARTNLGLGTLATQSGASSGDNTGDETTSRINALYGYIPANPSITNAYSDAKVADAINNGVTTIAPSQNAVYNALALKITQPDIVGTIIPTDTFASLTNWTVVGAGGIFSAASNELVCTGGSTHTLANYLANNYGRSNYSDIEFTATIRVGTISSTSFGVGFGLQTYSGGNRSNHIKIRLDTGNVGKIEYSKANTVGGLTKTSPNGCTLIAGDLVDIVINISKSKITTSLYTSTTRKNLNTFTYVFPTDYAGYFDFEMVGTFQYSIYACGGTHYIRNFKVDCLCQKGAIVCVGDSITDGIYGGVDSDIWPGQLEKLSGIPTVRYAASGTNIDNMVGAEVLALEPLIIVSAVGTNNIPADTPSAFLTKYQTMIAGFTGYTVGTNIFPCLILPRTTQDVTTWNTQLITTYSTYINLFNHFASGTAMHADYSEDGLHPNATGHREIAAIVFNNIRPYLPFRAMQNTDVNSVNYSQNGFASIGWGKSVSPNYQLSVQTKAGTNAAAIFLGNVGEATGGWLGGTVNGLTLHSNCLFNGTSHIAKSTTPSLIGMGGGPINFNVNSGATVGAAFTPVSRVRITTVGMYVSGGTIQDPADRLQIGAGSSTVAAFGLTSGTDLSSPLAGKFYYNGTRLGFSPSTTIKRIILSNDVAPSNGQIPIGNGTDYTVANITAGTNITITNASGSITIGTTVAAPIAASFSTTGTATTTFTVTIGSTLANSTYKVNVTPTAALSAAVFYVTNKTTTTFDVVYLAGLTGTVTFDWSLFP